MRVRARRLAFPRDLPAPGSALAVLLAASLLPLVAVSPAAADVVTPANVSTISTLAGTGTAGASGDGGAATSAQLNSPYSVAAGTGGSVYVADRLNSRIRSIDAAGVIRTVAGTGTAGFAGDDGPAAAAQLNQPRGVAVDAHGNVYVADTANQRIRKIDATGMITTVAGNGTAGFAGDGALAVDAQLNRPAAVAVDSDDNLVIVDQSNQRVRRVSAATGVITTIAGTGVAGYSGDTGPAVNAKLDTPGGVAIDAQGRVLIADTNNERVRRIENDGVISTIAGTGALGSAGDLGQATSAQLAWPAQLTLTPAGEILIADRGNAKIRMLDTSGVISTIAGTGATGSGGDGGPATQAQLNAPYGVAAGPDGLVYIADSGNHRIRLLDPVAATESAVDNICATQLIDCQDIAASASDILTRPDVVSAQIAAQNSGKPVQVTGLDDASTATFVRPDGSFVSAVAAGPIRGLDSAGDYQPIDLTLAAATPGVTAALPLGTSIAPQLAAVHVGFSGGGTGAAAALTVSPPGAAPQSVGFAWSTPLPAPTLSSATATYANVLPVTAPDTSMVLRATATGFEQSLILQHPPVAPLKVRIPVSLPAGVQVVSSPDGALRFVDPDGTLLASAPESVMYGAPVDEHTGLPVQLAKVDVKVVKTATGVALEVTPSMGFLTDPATTYPVTIDPAPALNATADTWVENDYTSNQNGSTELREGTWGSGSIARSLLKFDVSAFKGTHVLSAKLSVYQYHSWSCSARTQNLLRVTTTWTPSTVTYAGSASNTTSQPSVNSTPIATLSDAHGYSSSCPAAYSQFVDTDLTTLVNGWAQGTTANYGLELRAADESDEYSWKRFYSTNNGSTVPTLTVSYNSYPGTPGSRSVTPCLSYCAPQAWTSAARPVLTAAAPDNDGGKLRYDFEVWSGTAASPTTRVAAGSVSNVTAGAKAAWTLPVNLADGDYEYRVKAYDGIDSGPWSSGWAVFHVDTLDPVTPTVSSSQYPAGQWNVNGGSGTFTLATSSTDLDTYLYQLDNAGSLTPTGSTLTLTTIANGWHTLWVYARDKAGNVSDAASYAFGVGADITKPSDGARTSASVPLAALVSSAASDATYQYSTDDGSTWAAIPLGSGAVTVTATSAALSSWPVGLNTVSSTTKAPVALNWNLATTLAGVDKTVKLRACFSGVNGCSNEISVTLDQNAFGDAYATAPVGPGSVSLLTGNYALSATDASVSGNLATLSVARTFNSRTPGALGAGDAPGVASAQIFGPGWTATLPDDDAGVDYTALQDNTSSVSIVSVDGSKVGFTRTASGSYQPQAEAAADGLSLTKTATTPPVWTLTDLDGLQVVFKTPTACNTGGTGTAGPYVLCTVIQPGSAQTTSYTFDASGHVTSMLAPLPAGVTSCTPMVKGCRRLQVDYATSTTATGGALGNVLGQVSGIRFTGYDPATTAMSTVTLTSYRYDSNNRLREVTDARTGLAVSYTYDAAGRLASMTPPAQAPWTFNYDANNRLDTATRAPAGHATLTWRVRYGVPLTTSAGGPLNMTALDVAAWGQKDSPVTAAAVFGPAYAAHALSSPVDYTGADLTYIDVDGRPVNSASYGGPVNSDSTRWQVDTTEYDPTTGNVRRSLSAGNRQRALADTSGTGSAIVATYYDTQNVYDSTGAALVDTWGPAHTLLYTDANGQHQTGTARIHTHTDYDQGAPTTGGPYLLATTTSTGASLGVDTVGDASVDLDVRTTVTSYNGQSNLGWTLRSATSVTVDPGAGHLALTTTTQYDPVTGKPTVSTLPASTAGTDAHATVTSYYTGLAGTGPCFNHPEWQGLTCQTGPGGQPSGTSTPPLPITTTTYTLWNAPATTTETVTWNSTTTTRTTTLGYDTAGRPVRSSTSISPAVGAAIPTVTTVYNGTSGQVDSTNFVDSSGAVTASITRKYDDLGRTISYTDANGTTSSTSYDDAGRTSVVDDGKGTDTYTYDSSTDLRGQISTVTDSQAGIFSASYDADGNLTQHNLPNGVTERIGYDSTGDAISRSYTQGSAAWLSFTTTSDAAGQIRIARSTLSTQNYDYDSTGRLSHVEDTAFAGSTKTCTVRDYTFDADSNRNTLTTRGPNTDGTCNPTGPASTPETHSYDSADRLTDPGIVYDAFGRTTTLPGTPNDPAWGSSTASTTGDISLGYYANDLVANQSRGNRHLAWTLDPSLRFGAWTDTTDGGTSNGKTIPSTTLTHTLHYSGDGDSPSWTDEGNGTTRSVSGLDRNMTAQVATTASGASTTTYQLTNLHGDVVATYTAKTRNAPDATFENTEYGVPRTTSSTTHRRYQWLGGKTRSSDSLGGLTLMGVRLYNASTGRFLQVDPVKGGSANAYDYVNQDPINNFDLDGRMCFRHCHWKKMFHSALGVVANASEHTGFWMTVVSSLAVIACPECAIGVYAARMAVGAYMIGAASRAGRHEYRRAGGDLVSAGLAHLGRRGGMPYRLFGGRGLFYATTAKVWWHTAGGGRLED